MVDKPPVDVVSADVLGFITARRSGRRDTAVVQPVAAGQEAAGVAISTVARRLSIVSGFFAYLQARGDITANRVPRGLPTRRDGAPARGRVNRRRFGEGRLLGTCLAICGDVWRRAHSQPGRRTACEKFHKLRDSP